MSLLSELIARLHALIDRNSETEGDLQRVHDQVEGAIARIQAATVGSSSDLVAEGLAQWQAGLERLDQAHALMAAGDQTMTAYINGPLLGGAAGSASGGGGGGGKPPGRPVAPGPAPEPEPSRGHRGDPREVDITWPRFAPDPERRPGGPPTKLEGSADKQQALHRENESAKALAAAGYDIEQNPPTTPNGKNPDYRIQGELWDCYAPTGTSTRTIHKAIYDKVGKNEEDRQAERIVLNLDGSTVNPAEIRSRLARSPIRGLREIKIVKDGTVTQFYPWDTEVDDSGN